jgi:hypothetical protein
MITLEHEYVKSWKIILFSLVAIMFVMFTAPTGNTTYSENLAFMCDETVSDCNISSPEVKRDVLTALAVIFGWLIVALSLFLILIAMFSKNPFGILGKFKKKLKFQSKKEKKASNN